ncbi:MAG TPA: hypothetical protein VFQ45_18445, partial [Longimicrobium sp.]|nr:hypothetical protein [Longimicrobium sp.]
ACAVATSDTGTGKLNFPTSCAAGYEWLNASVTGLQTRWVLVGATISGTESDGKPSGMYEGTLTISLTSSSS